MMIIEIDPNVRVQNNWTYSSWDDVIFMKPQVGHGPNALVFERESGLYGPAKMVDHKDGLIYLEVDWSALTVLG